MAGETKPVESSLNAASPFELRLNLGSHVPEADVRQAIATGDVGFIHSFTTGSTVDGLPYFVMEYVDGKPVTQFVREHRLSVYERLELFLKIFLPDAVFRLSGRIELIKHHVDYHPSHRNVQPDRKNEPGKLPVGVVTAF